MSGKDNPTDYEVITATFEASISRRQSEFPGLVVAPLLLDGRVNVQPAIMIPASNGQQTPAKIVTIPIAWPSWGDIVIQGKLSVGDEVLVECMDKNWLAWLEVGGVSPDLAPGGHQSGYAVASPVQVSKVRRPIALDVATKLLVGTRDGTSTVVYGEDGSISVQSALVRLGAATTPTALPVARDTDPVNTNAAFTTWRTAMEAAVLPVVVPPLIGTAIGTSSATSTEVTST